MAGPAECLSEQRTVINGCVTRTIALPGRAPAVVFVHGYGDCALSWRPVMKQMAAGGRALVAADLPGFGLAPAPRDGPLLPQWEDFVAEMVRQAAQQTGDRVILAGNSLGGLLALRLSERADLPIAGAVPIAPGGLDRPRWVGLLDFGLGRALALPLPLPRHLVTLAVRGAYARFAQAATIDDGKDMAAAFARHHPTVSAVGRLLETGRRAAEEIEAGPLRIERIRCPLLVIWGAEDRLVSPDGARMLSETLPDVDVLMLPGCGHLPQLERPREVADAMLRFVPGRARGRIRRRGRRAA